MIVLTLLCAVLGSSAAPLPPVTLYDDIVYTANYTCYSAPHHIVDIHVPLDFDKLGHIYFVQQDQTKEQYKGLYRMKLDHEDGVKNGTVERILENGQCVASDQDAVYLGASDGIYIVRNDTVEKFGNVTADVIDIVKLRGADLVYIVTKDNKLFKVTEHGTGIEEHATIKNVEEIALDERNNLYFIEKYEDPERYLQYFERHLKPKVLVGDKVVEISGLPDKYTNLKLGSMMGHCVALVGNYFYKLSPAGTSEDARFGFVDTPTAMSLDLGLFQVFSRGEVMYCSTYFVERLGEAIGMALQALATGLKDALQRLGGEH